MEAMREAWTDRRLDGLSYKVGEFERRVDTQFERVDERFERVDERFDEVDGRLGRIEQTIENRFDSIDNRLGGIEDRFAAYQRAVFQMSGVLIAGLIGIIATQI
jgi:tetrahydromethanopterin S-methyltransferase subunit G